MAGIVPLMERIDPHSVAMGAAVRGAIASAGLSQSDAATQIGMGINTLSRRINGLLPFTWPELVRVAVVTGNNPSDLVASATRIAERAA